MSSPASGGSNKGAPTRKGRVVRGGFVQRLHPPCRVAVRLVLMPDFTGGDSSPISRMTHAAGTGRARGGQATPFVEWGGSVGLALGEHLRRGLVAGWADAARLQRFGWCWRRRRWRGRMRR